MCGITKGLCWLVPCLAALTALPLPAAEEKRETRPAAAAKPDAETASPRKPAEAKPTEANPSEPKQKLKKPTLPKKGDTPDPFVVPEGTPPELAEYINKVRRTRLSNMQMLMKLRIALYRAAEQIIAAQAGEKEMTLAVQIKMQLMPDPEHLAEFTAELKSLGQERYARMVRNFGLMIDLAKAEEEKGLKEQKAAIESAVRFLNEAVPHEEDARLALMAGKLAEMTGDSQYASKVYRSAAKPLALCKDEKLAEIGRTLAGISRRLALPGSEIKIEGRLVGGGDFDWSRYKGKVVLVNFWSTYNGSSVAELSKLKKYYERYRAQGLEIVGVSCDQRLADLEKFVQERNIPWAVVYGKDKPSPTVEHYGITNIPETIVVGRDGKVIMLHARGSKLKGELIKLFGPAEERK